MTRDDVHTASMPSDHVTRGRAPSRVLTRADTWQLPRAATCSRVHGSHVPTTSHAAHSRVLTRAHVRTASPPTPCSACEVCAHSGPSSTCNHWRRYELVNVYNATLEGAAGGLKGGKDLVDSLHRQLHAYYRCRGASCP